MSKWVKRVLPVLLVCMMLGGVIPVSEFFIKAQAALETKPMVVVGPSYTLAVKVDGTVWAWGNNVTGQLGNGTQVDRSAPIRISSLSNIVAVAAGGYYAQGFGHSLALRSDGTVWAWGWNAYGQLGNGTTTSRTTPVQISGINNVIAISASGSHTVALRNDGTVWAWGCNGDGQLGDGTTTDRYAPVQVQDLNNITAIAAATGDNLIPSMSSYGHTLALRSDGTVWAWGNNGNGKLGDNTSTRRLTPVQVQGLSNISAIAASSGHSVALRKDGIVWAWGNNSSGQLGDGTTTNRLTPVQIQGLSNIAAIAVSSSTTTALHNNGTVWTLGNNSNGQLGDGTTINRNAPGRVQGLTNVSSVSAGFLRGTVIKADGTVWAWGNNRGYLGDGTTEQRNTPVQILGENGSGHLNLRVSSDYVKVEIRSAATGSLIPDAQFLVYNNNASDDIFNTRDGTYSISRNLFPIRTFQAYHKDYEIYRASDIAAPGNGVLSVYMTPKGGNPNPVTGVKIYGADSMSVGEMYQFSAKTGQNNSTTVTWSSSNNSVATVNQNGQVYARANGTTTITVKTPILVSGTTTIPSYTDSLIVTVSNRNSVSNFSYNFTNWYDDFGYPYHRENGRPVSDYKIPLARYQEVFGNTEGLAKWLMDGNWGGSCYGMSASSTMFVKKNVYASSYSRNASRPLDLNAPGNSDAALTKFIERVQLSQSKSYIQSYAKATENDYAQIVNAVKAFGLNSNDPPIIRVYSNGVGHALVGLYVDERDSEDRVYIYDPNLINDSSTYITFRKNGTGSYTSWEYGSYASNRTNARIQLIRYSALIQSMSGVARAMSFSQPLVLFSRTKGDFTITNGTGGSASFANDVFSTNIEQATRIDLVDNFSPNEMFNLPFDNYVIAGNDNSDAVTMFSVGDNIVAAKSIAKSEVEFSFDNGIYVSIENNNENNAFEISYIHDGKSLGINYDSVILSGETSGKVSTREDNGTIFVEGVDSLNVDVVISGITVSTAASNLMQKSNVRVVIDAARKTVQIVDDEAALSTETALPERLKVAKPIGDLTDGGYGELNLVAADDETIIYYTTDGSEPSIYSTVYSAPILISKSMTVKAISAKFGFEDSETLELVYTHPFIPVPVIVPNFLENSIMLLSDNDADIYYTLDGSDPLENGVLYTTPIVLYKDATLRTVAIKNNRFSETILYECIIDPSQKCVLINTPTNQLGDVIAADNLFDTTELNLVFQKLSVGILNFNINIEFYDAEDTLIDSRVVSTRLDEEINYINVIDVVVPSESARARIYKDDGVILDITLETYELAVINGAGNGNFAAGANVSITADEPPSGQVFKQWNINPSVNFTDNTNANSVAAKFIMPAEEVTATAIYEDDPAVLLSNAKQDKIAAINAVTSGLNEADYTAASWQALQTAIGQAIAAVEAAATVEAVNAVAVPGTAMLVTKAAELAEAKQAKTAVINAVINDLNEADYTAASWQALQTAISTAIAQVNAATTVAAVNAVSVPTTDGLVSKATELAAAKTAKIAAINAVTNGLISADYTTASWQALQTAISTAIVQVNAATTVAAVNAVSVPTIDGLVRVYALTVSDGSGSGNYTAGTTVTITANAAPSGKVFDKWTATAGTLTNANGATTTFTMPAGTATVTATYKNEPTIPANKTALNNLINEIGNTQKGNYTDATWQTFQSSLSDARTVANNESATQAQVDAALNALNTAYAGLRENQPPSPVKGIFGTNARWYGAWWHYILFFICFGFIWMWF